MTTALYRRYRPETFEQVIGQEHVTEPLMAALASQRVTHAYLFSGPRGCGKTTSARILARCLNCANYPTATPCGECESCVDLARGGTGSLDVVEIDAASHGGVDDARELRERATFAPARDRFKIFIIDEAHMVSPQGFNALLKLVEEPPDHVKFVFATTEPEKVIGTIRSRTHHYPFRLVPPETLEHYLAQLAAEEHVEIGGGVFPLVVRAGGGSVRDTLSVLDQLIAGAIDGQVEYQRAAALLGYTDSALLDSVIDAIGARDGAALFGAVDRVVQSGHDPRRFVEDLLQRLRDLVVLAMAGEAGAHALGGLAPDAVERLRAQAEHIGARRLSAVADLTNDALTEMSGATSPRLQLELLCARILLVGEEGNTGAAGRAEAVEVRQAAAPPRLRVEDSKVRLGGTRPPIVADQPAQPVQPAQAVQPAQPAQPVQPAQAAQPAQPVQGAERRAPDTGAQSQMIQQRWQEAVGALESRFLQSMVGQNARPGELSGDTLRVDFTNAALVVPFQQRDGEVLLSQALFEALGVRVRVMAAAGGDATPPPAAMGGWNDAPAQQEAPTQPGAPAQQGTSAQYAPEPREQHTTRREPAPAPSSEGDPHGYVAAEEVAAPAPEQAPAPTPEQAPEQAPKPMPEPAAAPVAEGGFPPAAPPMAAPDPEPTPTPSAAQDGDGGWPTVAVPGAGYVPDPVEESPSPLGLQSKPASAHPEEPREHEYPTAIAEPAPETRVVIPADLDEPKDAAPTASSFESAVKSALTVETAKSGDPDAPAAPVVALTNGAATEPVPTEAAPADEARPYAARPVEQPAAVSSTPPGFVPTAASPEPEPPMASAGRSEQPSAPPAHPWEKFLPASVRLEMAADARSGEGDAAGSSASWGSKGASPQEIQDDISPDDADIEESTAVGLDVLKDMLGAVVIEEIDTTGQASERKY